MAAGAARATAAPALLGRLCRVAYLANGALADGLIAHELQPGRLISARGVTTASP